eukprot:m.287282 g.287282  ORF g.287282 m.287282 type:complete len:1527 (-) comp15787_c5_seq8:386-4966(-)
MDESGGASATQGSTLIHSQTRTKQQQIRSNSPSSPLKDTVTSTKETSGSVGGSGVVQGTSTPKSTTGRQTLAREAARKAYRKTNISSSPTSRGATSTQDSTRSDSSQASMEWVTQDQPRLTRSRQAQLSSTQGGTQDTPLVSTTSSTARTHQRPNRHTKAGRRQIREEQRQRRLSKLASQGMKINTSAARRMNKRKSAEAPTSGATAAGKIDAKGEDTDATAAKATARTRAVSSTAKGTPNMRTKSARRVVARPTHIAASAQTARAPSKSKSISDAAEAVRKANKHSKSGRKRILKERKRQMALKRAAQQEEQAMRTRVLKAAEKSDTTSNVSGGSVSEDAQQAAQLAQDTTLKTIATSSTNTSTVEQKSKRRTKRSQGKRSSRQATAQDEVATMSITTVPGDAERFSNSSDFVTRSSERLSLPQQPRRSVRQTTKKPRQKVANQQQKQQQPSTSNSVTLSANGIQTLLAGPSPDLSGLDLILQVTELRHFLADMYSNMVVPSTSADQEVRRTLYEAHVSDGTHVLRVLVTHGCMRDVQRGNIIRKGVVLVTSWHVWFDDTMLSCKPVVVLEKWTILHPTYPHMWLARDASNLVPYDAEDTMAHPIVGRRRYYLDLYAETVESSIGGVESSTGAMTTLPSTRAALRAGMAAGAETTRALLLPHTLPIVQGVNDWYHASTAATKGDAHSSTQASTHSRSRGKETGTRKKHAATTNGDLDERQPQQQLQQPRQAPSLLRVVQEAWDIETCSSRERRKHFVERPLCGRITKKTHVFHYGKSTEYMRYPMQSYIELSDRSGSIAVVLWGHACKQWHSLLELDDVILIRNYRVKPASTHCSLLNTDTNSYAFEVALNYSNPASSVELLDKGTLRECAQVILDSEHIDTAVDDIEGQSNGEVYTATAVSGSAVAGNNHGQPAAAAASPPAMHTGVFLKLHNDRRRAKYPATALDDSDDSTNEDEEDMSTESESEDEFVTQASSGMVPGSAQHSTKTATTTTVSTWDGRDVTRVLFPSLFDAIQYTQTDQLRQRLAGTRTHFEKTRGVFTSPTSVKGTATHREPTSASAPFASAEPAGSSQAAAAARDGHQSPASTPSTYIQGSASAATQSSVELDESEYSTEDTEDVDGNESINICGIITSIGRIQWSKRQHYGFRADRSKDPWVLSRWITLHDRRGLPFVLKMELHSQPEVFYNIACRQPLIVTNVMFGGGLTTSRTSTPCWLVTSPRTSYIAPSLSNLHCAIVQAQQHPKVEQVMTLAKDRPFLKQMRAVPSNIFTPWPTAPCCSSLLVFNQSLMTSLDIVAQLYHSLLKYERQHVYFQGRVTRMGLWSDDKPLIVLDALNMSTSESSVGSKSTRERAATSLSKAEEQKGRSKGKGQAKRAKKQLQDSLKQQLEQIPIEVGTTFVGSDNPTAPQHLSSAFHGFDTKAAMKTAWFVTLKSLNLNVSCDVIIAPPEYPAFTPDVDGLRCSLKLPHLEQDVDRDADSEAQTAWDLFQIAKTFLNKRVICGANMYNPGYPFGRELVMDGMQAID